MSKERKMEKKIWQGTFAEAEERDNLYWTGQSEQSRLAALLEIREVLFDNYNARIERVAFKRILGEEE